MLFSSFSLAQELSNKATFSLLIASPDPEQVVSSYGHTLLRVQDPELNIDYVINYGTFDKSLTGFQTFIGIIRSKLEYEIWVMPFAEYYQETKTENRTLVEHVFNFSLQEKNLIWQKLISMVKEKDSKYTFDFFSQNCTTFARDLITYNLGNKIVLPDSPGTKTYRDINLKYVKNKLWYVFTIDLLSGNNLQKRIEPYQSLYEPKELENAWTKSYISDNNGAKKALFASSSILLKGKKVQAAETPLLLSPMFFGIVFLLLILCISVLEWKTKNFYKWFDISLFGAAGILGFIFYLFKIVCARWYVLMDWDMMWLHPLHLLVVLFIFKSFKKSLVAYHYINSAVLGLLITIMIIGNQPFNTAITLFTAGLFTRSVTFLFRKKYQIIVKAK